MRRLVAIGANYDVNGLDPKVFASGFFAQEAQDVKPFYEAVAPDPKHFAVLMRKILKMISTQPHYTMAELGRIRARAAMATLRNSSNRSAGRSSWPSDRRRWQHPGRPTPLGRPAAERRP